MLHCEAAKLGTLSTFSSLAHCPRCDDLMIAPLASEFVAGEGIRHHWECETCGARSSSTISLCNDHL